MLYLVPLPVGQGILGGKGRKILGVRGNGELPKTQALYQLSKAYMGSQTFQRAKISLADCMLPGPLCCHC